MNECVVGGEKQRGGRRRSSFVWLLVTCVLTGIMKGVDGFYWLVGINYLSCVTKIGFNSNHYYLSTP